MDDNVYAKLLLMEATCKTCKVLLTNKNKWGRTQRPKCCTDLRKNQGHKRNKTKQNFVCENWVEG